MRMSNCARQSMSPPTDIVNRSISAYLIMSTYNTVAYSKYGRRSICTGISTSQTGVERILRRQLEGKDAGAGA